MVIPNLGMVYAIQTEGRFNLRLGNINHGIRLALNTFTLKGKGKRKKETRQLSSVA